MELKKIVVSSDITKDDETMMDSLIMDTEVSPPMTTIDADDDVVGNKIIVEFIKSVIGDKEVGTTSTDGIVTSVVADDGVGLTTICDVTVSNDEDDNNDKEKVLSINAVVSNIVGATTDDEDTLSWDAAVILRSKEFGVISKRIDVSVINCIDCDPTEVATDADDGTMSGISDVDNDDEGELVTSAAVVIALIPEDVSNNEE